jgi:hypothetical protein
LALRVFLDLAGLYQQIYAQGVDVNTGYNVKFSSLICSLRSTCLESFPLIWYPDHEIIELKDRRIHAPSAQAHSSPVSAISSGAMAPFRIKLTVSSSCLLFLAPEMIKMEESSLSAEWCASQRIATSMLDEPTAPNL